MSYPDNRKFKVSACGSNNPVGVLRQSYGLGVYGPRSEVKEGDVVAACECCPEVRYLSATLEWVGYERFVCEGDDPIDYSDRDRTKYLVYTTSGEASVSDCSGTANYQTSNATQTWTIDPLTGLPSYSGPGTQNVSYLCGSGTSTCSPTQKQKTCTISGDDPCTDAEETERTVTFTETLSGDYRLNDVAGRIDQAVGGLDLYSETQGIPDGTVGFLENGTGHSIVRLSPAQNAYASCEANGCPSQLNALWVETFNSTTRQWFVTKQYIYIKFKDMTEYKVYRKNITTGEIKESKETGSGEKIIKANKLNEEVWVSVSSGNEFYGCGDGYKCVCYTMAGCEDTGQKSYKQSSQLCTPLIGPDCQQYFSSMYTEMATATESGSTIIDLGGGATIENEGNDQYNKTSSIETTACPSSSVENSSETETRYTRYYAAFQTETYVDNYQRTVSNNSVSETGTKGSSSYAGFGAASCQCQKSITTPFFAPLDPDQEIGSMTTNCTTTIGAATITTASSAEGQYEFQDPFSRTYSLSASRTETTVWYNPTDGESLETVYDETNYTNTAWLQTGFDNLGRYYVSRADVKKKCKVKFTACETNQTVVPFDQPVDYEVLLHCAIRTLNQEDPDNPILTWEVDNKRETVRSKGGPESKEFDIEIPTPTTDKTVAALAYSTCTVWKKPN